MRWEREGALVATFHIYNVISMYLLDEETHIPMGEGDDNSQYLRGIVDVSICP